MTSQITITNAGITVPQASDVKEAFQGVFTNAFGTDLSLDDATPQGSMIDDFTTMKQASNTNDLYLFNQINPETAEGIFQDAIGSLYGMKRKTAQPSIVTCQCVGGEGTVIDTNAIAQNTNGDLFRAVETKTIPSSGTVDVQFESVETGSIPCGSNTVNRIYSVITGWDSVNNATAGTLGYDVESRLDFEVRRKKTLARNSTGSVDAMVATLYECDGVRDVCVKENCENSPKTIEGVTVSGHSVYICVNGGTDSDIAEAIYNSKSAGCDTTNLETADTVTVNYNGNTYYFQRPTNETVYIKIGLSQAVSSATETIIKDAIIEDWNGTEDDPSITIGDSIYASRFYANIAKLSISNLQLVNVKVSKDGTTWADVLDYDIDELPTIEATNISFVEV